MNIIEKWLILIGGIFLGLFGAFHIWQKDSDGTLFDQDLMKHAISKGDHSILLALPDDLLLNRLNIRINSNYALALDAPWRMQLRTESKQESFGREILSEDGFISLAHSLIWSSKTSEPINVELVAFLCSKDKTRCFREKHVGSLHH